MRRTLKGRTPMMTSEYVFLGCILVFRIHKCKEYIFTYILYSLSKYIPYSIRSLESRQ